MFNFCYSGLLVGNVTDISIVDAIWPYLAYLCDFIYYIVIVGFQMPLQFYCYCASVFAPSFVVITFPIKQKLFTYSTRWLYSMTLSLLLIFILWLLICKGLSQVLQLWLTIKRYQLYSQNLQIGIEGIVLWIFSLNRLRL